MKIIRYCCCIFLTCSSAISRAQLTDSTLKISPQLSQKYYSEVNKKISAINKRLTRKSGKYLANFARHAAKLQQRMAKLDPQKAKDIFNNTPEKYDELSCEIKSGSTNIDGVISGPYDPYLDSLGASLNYLKQFDGTAGKVKDALASFKLLQSKLQQSEKIKEFIAQKKDQIRAWLSGYTKIPGGLKSQYDKLRRTAYYYRAQVNQYREMLKDPKKTEQKALDILNRLPAFQKFIQQNGQLASLFTINQNVDPVQCLTGLQTRSSLQAIIQQRVASGGPGAGQLIRQNIAQANSELTRLKEKINQYGGGGDIEMPDFKPNDQKTKPFLKRLEYSVNVQFARTNNLLPSCADIGLGIGYKLNNKCITGIAASYKIGMGTARNIALTHQGAGFRSYADFKLKGTLFIYGGYEMNYNAAFKNIAQLKNYNAWQRSALIGVSKKYKFSKKVKGTVQALYDFLAHSHLPVSQQLLFRAGYNL